MLKFNSFLLLLMLVFAGYSQNYIQYHNLCNEGCQLMEDGLYAEAKEKILDAIDLVEQPLSIDYFNLAKCYSVLYAPEATAYYLELSLKITNRGLRRYEEHVLWFEPVLGKEKWSELLNADYSKVEPTKLQGNILSRIDTLLKIENKYLQLYFDSIVVYHPDDSVLLEIYMDSIELNYSVVSNELEVLVNEFGWPGFKLNGFTNMDFGLAHGRSAEWFDKMESKLIEEIDKGNLYPWIFVDMADRAQGEKNLPCKYNGAFCYLAITQEIKANCRKVGAPLGQVKKIRRLN